MTPAARIQAATEILDGIAAGAPAERALTNWARAHRFAGSKDRAAIRDHVFDALRRWRSYAALGGGETGRALMIGALRAAGADPAALFTGDTFAPAPLSADEGRGAPPAPGSAIALDCPDDILPHFRRSLGADADAVLLALRDRAPVHLRVNIRQTSRDAAIARLAGEGIAARPHRLSPTALEVTANERRVRGSQAYREGLVELQDAASQAVSDQVPVRPGGSVLDYCAGGGGKTLAISARADARFFAYDVDAARMRDLPERADRAGVRVDILRDQGRLRQAGYDTVLADVPCSGSGAWRRAPQAKWGLTAEKLSALTRRQSQILEDASEFVAQDGWLVYATCSLFDIENRDRIEAFLRAKPGWQLERDVRFTPLDGGDGFYAARLRRKVENST